MNCVYAMFDDFPIHGHDTRFIEWNRCKYFGRTQNIKERVIEHKKRNGKGVIRKVENKYGKCVMIFWDAGSVADMMLIELFMILNLHPEFNSESSMKDIDLTYDFPFHKFALSRLSAYRYDVAYITNGVCINQRKKAKWRENG